MARKRKLDSSIPAETETNPAEGQGDRKGAMGGLWAGSAMNMLKQRIDDTHGSLVKGIVAGTVALELDPDQVRDDIGSDRVVPWIEDEDFEKLVSNIARRGQTQPIRVRPARTGWAPDPADPLNPRDTFIIQSGRRRLEACRRLGRKVLAIVATEEGDRALADLEERFHENTMRKNLNGFEELVSIGLLAESLKELTQTEIAERLGVSQGDVSLGLACLEHRDAILAQVDIATTPKRQYRTILPRLKRGEGQGGDGLPKALKGDFAQPYDVRGIPMSTRPTKAGFRIDIKQARVAEENLEDLLVEIAKLVMKYQIKKK